MFTDPPSPGLAPPLALPADRHRGLQPRRTGGLRQALRTILALVIREMSTTYGRSAMGYLWAVLEPVGGIMLLSLVFSLAFRSPSIGTSFPLFYASGMLPFMAHQQTSMKVAGALRFSRQLLFYPRVTFLDALIARLLLSALTQTLVFVILVTAILTVFRIDVILNLPAIALALVMTFLLGFGIGTLNCFLFWLFPTWYNIWTIANRPMFVLSCVLFLFDDVPRPYRDWLWWNPLVHVVGQMRIGIYATYDGSYVSPLYVIAVAFVALALGLVFLRRWHQNILET
jgi:capsular polysaccharide transport system permease protein